MSSLECLPTTLKEVELLKIVLLNSGMNVSDAARKAIEGDDKRPLTLADYASTSGISMELENDVWVNAPIKDYNPNFVSESQFTLDFVNGEVGYIFIVDYKKPLF